MECWVGRHLEVWLWLCSASNSWVHYSLEILQTILKTRPIKHALLCNIQFWTATLENKYDPRFMVEYVWFVCARPSYGLYEMLSLNFSESLPSIMINGYGWFNYVLPTYIKSVKYIFLSGKRARAKMSPPSRYEICLGSATWSAWSSLVLRLLSQISSRFKPFHLPGCLAILIIIIIINNHINTMIILIIITNTTTTIIHAQHHYRHHYHKPRPRLFHGMYLVKNSL